MKAKHKLKITNSVALNLEATNNCYIHNQVSHAPKNNLVENRVIVGAKKIISLKVISLINSIELVTYSFKKFLTTYGVRTLEN